jgi:hypothetical protein
MHFLMISMSYRALMTPSLEPSRLLAHTLQVRLSLWTPRPVPFEKIVWKF